MSNNNSILLWLAASRFSDRDLQDFFGWISRTGGNDAYRNVENLRAGKSQDSRAGRFLEKNSLPKNSADAARIEEHSAMVKEVEKLLLIDAKLSKSEATRILLFELEDIETQYGYLSSPNKISFRSWLARLGEDVSDSRVLHVASKIRNSLVHGDRSTSDWPIS